MNALIIAGVIGAAIGGFVIAVFMGFLKSVDEGAEELADLDDRVKAAEDEARDRDDE